MTGAHKILLKMLTTEVNFFMELGEVTFFSYCFNKQLFYIVVFTNAFPHFQPEAGGDLFLSAISSEELDQPHV